MRKKFKPFVGIQVLLNEEGEPRLKVKHDVCNWIYVPPMPSLLYLLLSMNDKSVKKLAYCKPHHGKEKRK